MNNKGFKEIVITKNNYFRFPAVKCQNTDVLILGNYNGICSDAKWYGESGNMATGDFIDVEKTFYDNYLFLSSVLRTGGRIAIAASAKTIEYFKNVLYCGLFYTGKDGDDNELRKEIKDIINRQVKVINTDEIYERTYTKYENKSSKRKKSAEEHLDMFINNLFKILSGVKFDIIIQNPPFNGRLHLDFLEKGIELLKDNGRMTIIEPSTWLIDVRKKGCRARKRYDDIKNKLSGHVESVVIENFNDEFNTDLYVPFSITTIDMSKTFDEIDFTCCGEHKKVKSLNECNLIGDYQNLMSILDKIRSYGDMMHNHITTKQIPGDNWYIRCVDCGKGGVFTAGSTEAATLINNDTYYFNGYNRFYFNVAYNTVGDNIFSTPGKSFNRGGGHVESNKTATNVYGTYDEMKNWEHFIMSNKLSLFINIVVGFDQNNNSDNYLPWIVDKKYTDEELYEMFDISEDEKRLIEITLEKFKRDSPWFKRLAGGPDYISDEEVNKFMKGLYIKC